MSVFASHLILTTYFTQKEDPQRIGIYHEPDQFEKIRRWYGSVMRLGLHAAIFHDGLSEAFVQQHGNEHVVFMPYTPQTGRSPNDERFYCYLDFLDAHPEIQYAFMTDLFDVDFLRDPFDLINDEKYDFYSQTGIGGLPNGKKKYAVTRMKQAYGRIFHPDRISLNAGIIGGRRDHLLRLLIRMVADFKKAPERHNVNIGVFNRCINDVCPDPERILHGFPLHSEFKKYEEDRGFYIRHK